MNPNEQVDAKLIRLLCFIGTLLLSFFIIADLSVLPDSLTSVYAVSRFYIQLPVCIIFFSLTCTSFYPKIHQVTVCTVILALIYSNYWLIIRCWELQQFSFPYEGTIVYSLFALFVLRIKFASAVFLSAVAFAGYVSLMVSYPVYKDSNLINLCFVASSTIVGLLGVYQIDSGLKKLRNANDKLIELNQIDQLTQIYNRGTYEAKFNQQLIQNINTNKNICVYIVDLDSFKKYNDRYGHIAGDQIIKLQAEMLTDIFNSSDDIVARYGGEEFVVITSGKTDDECHVLAEKIINQWEDKRVPHIDSDNTGYVTCSVGFVCTTINAQSNKEEMVKKADTAMYQAKKQGRNCFVCYQEIN